MTLFPIVERELRLAARRKSTFRIRSWTAILAILICFVSMFFLWVSSGGRNIAKPLFVNLTGYVFGLSLLAGVFLTSDSLSEEKREGTLGLLFLTDLSGYDVVLGKFVARSLYAFLALAAVLPFMAVPVTLGGVTGAEFWRASLVLLNTLFFSLCAGICVSAFLRDSNRAIANTLGLVLLVTAGLPALGRAFELLAATRSWSVCAWVSPGFSFAHAFERVYATAPARFWWPLLISNSVGLFLLFLAARALPNRWQDSSPQRTAAFSPDHVRIPGRKRLISFRESELTANPVAALAGQDKVIRRFAWLIVAAWALVYFSILTTTSPAVSLFAFGQASGFALFGFSF